jgi:hypothetical protein
MDDQEDPGWSRSEWARWWIDHDEVDEAARALEPGDVVALGHSDFLNLQAALVRRGLTAQYEDGSAFVYTPAQAEQLAEAGRPSTGIDTRPVEPRTPDARKPPARSAAPEPLRSKRTA